MHNKLVDLSDVALFEHEVIGPELVGTIEFDVSGQHMFEGALVVTTKRLFVNVIDKYGDILKKDIRLKDISDVRRDEQFLLGKGCHIWIDNEVIVSMYGLQEAKLDKFINFIRKYRARALHIDSKEHIR
jgi:hypothetical protein